MNVLTAPVRLLLFAALLLAGRGAHAGSPLDTGDFVIPPGVYSAEFIEDRDHLTVIEFAGNYDRTLPDGGFNSAARAVVAQEFYRTHPDNYDFLVIFTDFEFDTGEALAFYGGVQNDITGINQPIFNNTARYGSNGRLQGTIDMAALSRYKENPLDDGFDLSNHVLAHELLHRFGVGTRFIDSNGQVNDALIGPDGVHWSFFAHTGASVEYGHEWRNNADGTFSAVAARLFYSPLDLYLMGFYQKEQVPDFFYIEPDPGTEFASTDLPRQGVTIGGTPVTVSIDDVIAAEGPRVPGVEGAQKEFRMAFILLTADRQQVDLRSVIQVNNIRRSFSERFPIMTGGNGIVHVYPEGISEASAGEVADVSSEEDFRAVINAGDALTWLREAQREDGSWQDKSASAFRDTTLVLETLQELDPFFSSSGLALDWIEQAPLKNNDDRARFYSFFPRSSLEADLLLNGNSDGGWGLQAGFDSDPLDTSLILQSGVVVDRFFRGVNRFEDAVQYLGLAQNSDGGWGPSSEAPSDVVATAAVLDALLGQDASFADAALTFLINLQQPDGGFGVSGASTVTETALALIQIARFERTDEIDVTAAANYLGARQRLGGDFDNSVYVTAIAVQAIQSITLPNLVLTATSTVEETLFDGERVTINLNIRNDGQQPSDTTSVRLYAGDPEAGGVLIDSAQVDPLGRGGQTNLTLIWDSFGQIGSQQLFVALDEDGLVSERTTIDNGLQFDLDITEAPVSAELEINEREVVAVPAAPDRIPSNIAFSAIVRNVGQTDSGPVSVALLQAGEIVDTAVVIVPARTSAVANLTALLEDPGETVFTVVADIDNNLAEADESNNEASVSVTTIDSVDLEITEAGVVLPASLAAGDDVVIAVDVANRGTLAAPLSQVVVEIVSSEGTLELLTGSFVFEPGETKRLEVPWLVNLEGELNVVVTVDGGNLVPEDDETNNTVSVPVISGQQAGFNLSTSFRDINFVPNPALEGSGLTISTIVVNTGAEDVASLDIAFYDGDPQAGGILLGEVTETDVLASEQRPVSFDWPSVDGDADRIIFIVVDPANLIGEFNEADKVAFTQVDVKSLPDLQVAAGSIVTAPAFPAAGEQFDITISVNNTGMQDAEDVLVELYDGGLDDGFLIGSTTLAIVTANGTASTSFTHTFAGDGARSLTLVVDSSELIVEGSELNNIAVREIAVQDGNFAVTRRHISPNGDGVGDQVDFQFNLDSAQRVSGVVLNALGETVRTIALTDEAVLSGVVSWDGLDDEGRLAGDGAYSFVLFDEQGVQLAEAGVSIDNNRLPLAEALGTDFQLTTNLACRIGEILDAQAPDNAVFFFSNYYNRNHSSVGMRPGPVYSSIDDKIYFATYLEPFVEDGELQVTDERVLFESGFYRADSDGTNVTALGLSVDERDVRDIVVTPDGSRLFVVTARELDVNPSPFVEDIQQQVEFTLVDSDGSNEQLLLEFSDSQGSGAVRTDFRFLDDNTLIYLGLRGGATDIWQLTLTAGSTPQLIASFDDSTIPSALFDKNPVFTLNQARTHGLMQFTESQLAGASGLLTERSHNPAVLLEISTGQLTLLGESVAAAFSRAGDRLAVASPETRLIEIRDLDNVTLQTFTMAEQFPGEGLPLFGRFRGITWGPSDARIVVAFEDYAAFIRYEFEPGFPPPFTDNVDLGGIYLLTTATGDLEKVARIGILPPSQFDGPDPVEVPEPVLTNNANGYPLNEENLPYLLWTRSDSWKGDPNGRVKELTWMSERNVLVSGSPSGQGPLGSPLLLDVLSPGSQSRAVLTDRNISGYRARVSLSNTGKFLTFYPDDPLDACNGVNDGHRQVQSLLNLTADIKAFRTAGGGIELRGTAADKNFDRYVLEYATADDPDSFFEITPPSTNMVIDDLFTTWVPDFGSYFVRLTVFDDAGNVAQDIVQTTYSDDPPIAAVLSSPQQFSPNGDGIAEEVSLSFDVRQPVNLELNVFGEDGALVRSITSSFSNIGVRRSIIWNGRDDAGIQVPDGNYALVLGDLRYNVTVDRTPPAIEDITQPFNDPSCTSFDENNARECTVRSNLSVEARMSDAIGLAETRLERRALGTSDWITLRTTEDEERVSSNETISQLRANEYRVVATDVVGNEATLVLDTSEKRDQVLTLNIGRHLNDNGEIVTSFLNEGTAVKYEEIYNFSSPGTVNIVPLAVAAEYKPFRVLIQETFDREVDAVELLFRPSPAADYTAAAPVDYGVLGCTILSPCYISTGTDVPDDAFFAVFDPAATGFEPFVEYEMKLRLTLEDGTQVETLTVVFNDESGYIIGKFGSTKLFVQTDDTIPDITSMELLVQSNEDPRFVEQRLVDATVVNEETAIVVSSPFGPPIVLVPLDVSTLLSCVSYNVTVRVNFAIGGEPLELKEKRSSSCIGITDRKVFYREPSETQSCNSPASDTLRVRLEIEASDDRVLSTLSLGTPGVVADELDEVLFNVIDPAEGFHNFVVDKTVYAEGVLDLRAVLVSTDNDVATSDFDVDIVHTSPEVTIGDPLNGSQSCGVLLRSGDIGLPFSGSITTAGRAVDYTVTSANGGCGEGCTASTVRLPDDQELVLVEPSTAGFVTSLNGTFAMPTFGADGIELITVEVRNNGGALQCATVEVDLDTKVDDFSAASMGGVPSKTRLNKQTSYYSPNGDGQYDVVSTRINVLEPVAAKVEIYSTLESAGEHVDDQLVTVVADELAIGAGETILDWNGVSGGIVTEGIYRVRVNVRDGCGFIEETDFLVAIDITPPAVDLVAPQIGDPLGNIIAFRANATDERFASHQLNVQIDDQSLALADGSEPLDGGAEGALVVEWDRVGLSGPATVTFSAVDIVANSAEVQRAFDLGNPAELIKSHEVVAERISPNADGRFDTAVMRTQFGADLTAVFQVLSGDAVVRTITDSAFIEGLHTVTWDGLDNGGAPLPDGEYQLRVIATFLGVNQTETVSTLLDATPPIVSVEDVENGFIIRDDNLINGQISDDNLESYQVSIVLTPDGDVVSTVLAEGSENIIGLLTATSGEPFAQEGIYELLFRAIDDAGNETVVTTKRLIDVTPPSVSIAAPLPDVFINKVENEFTVIGFVEDEYPRTFSLDFAPFNSPESITNLAAGEDPNAEELAVWNTGALPDARYVLTLSAEDLAGNDALVTHVVTIDGTLPVATITAPSAGYIKESFTVTGTASDDNLRQYLVSFSAIDGSSDTDLIVGSSNVLAGQLVNVGALPEDGEYRLRLRVSDKADNEAVDEVIVTVDTTPPAVPTGFTSDADNQGQSVTLTWLQNTEPDFSHYEVFRNGSLIEDDLTELVFEDSGLGQGEYSYQIRAVDLAGLSSGFTAPEIVTIDLEPPTVVLTSPNPDETVNGAVSIIGTAFSDEDFASYEVSIEVTGGGSQVIANRTLPVQGGELAQWSTLGIAEDTPVTITLTAEDDAGNKGSTSITVTVDNTAPPAPTNLAAIVSGDTVDASWDYDPVVPDLAGFLLFRNGKLANATGVVVGDLLPFAIGTQAYTHENVPDGEQTYVVHAVDATGNIGPGSDPITVTVETSPPAAVISNITSGQLFESSLLLTATSEDNDVATVSLEQREVGQSTWNQLVLDDNAPYFYQWDTSALGIGNYELRAVATDTSGNVDPLPAIVPVEKRDLNAPDAAENLVGSSVGDVGTLTWDAVVDTDPITYRLYQFTPPEAQDLEFTLNEINQDFGLSLTALDEANLATLSVELLIQALGFNEIGDTQLTTFTINNDEDETLIYLVVAEDPAGNQASSGPLTTVIYFTAKLDIPLTPRGDANVQYAGRSTASFGTAQFSITDTSGAQNVDVLADENGDFVLDWTLQSGRTEVQVAVLHSAGPFVSRPAFAVTNLGVAPSAPTGLSGFESVPSSEVTLNWDLNNPAENIITYPVTRDGELVNPVTVAFPDSVDGNINTHLLPRLIDDDIGTNVFMFAPSSADNFEVSLQFSAPQLLAGVELTLVTDGADSYLVSAYDGEQYVPLKVFTGIDPQQSVVRLTLDAPYLTDDIRFAPLLAEDEGGIRVAEARVLQHAPLTTAEFIEVTGEGSFEYSVAAVNDLGILGPSSAPETVVVGQPASGAPVLNGQVSGSDVLLSWTQVPGSLGYQIYRDGLPIDGVPGEANTAYVDQSLADGTYAYAVSAIDSGGQEGDLSNIVLLTVDTGGGGGGVGIPQNVTAVGSTTQALISLSWTQGPGDTPVGYLVVRSLGGVFDFQPIANVTTTNYDDTTVGNGVAYDYFIVAQDDVGGFSDPSDTVTATATFTVAPPAAPVITAPTTAGVPLTTSANTIDISVQAEAGVSVSLARNGSSLPNVPETGFGGLATAGAPIPNESWQMKVAPDGTLAAIVNEPGQFAPVFFVLEDGVWFAPPLGAAVYDFIWADADNVVLLTENDELLLANDLGASVLPLPQDYLPFQLLEMRPGEQVIRFVGLDQLNFIEGVFAFDLTDGSVTQLLPGLAFGGSSPDGEWFAFNPETSPNLEVSLYNTVSGSVTSVSVPGGVDGYYERVDSNPFSPNSQRLLIEGGNGTPDIGLVGVYNVVTGQFDAIIEEPDHYISGTDWLSDTVVVYSRVDEVNNSEVVTFDLTTNTREVIYTHSSPAEISIAYQQSDGQGTVYVNEFAGNVHFPISQGLIFTFRDVALDPGLNVFDVTATDLDTGLTSTPSSPIEVTLTEGAQAALDASLVVTPDISVVGTGIDIEVTVNNTGDALPFGATLSLHAISPSDEVTTLIDKISVDGIAASSSIVFNETYISSESGEQEIVATLLHPLEEDELVINIVSVVEEAAPTLSLSLAPSIADNFQFETATALNGSVALTNNGGAFNGTIEVLLLDAEGFAIQTLATQTLNDFGFGASQDVAYAGSTGTLFAGDYVIEARLLDETGSRISGGSQAFTILPDDNFALTLDVAQNGRVIDLAGELSNLSANSVAGDAALRFVVEDSGASIVFDETITLPQLLPGDAADATTTWNAAGQPAGTYNIRLEIAGRADPVATETITLAAENAAITGQVSLVNARVIAGDGILLGALLSNNSVAAANSLDVTMTLINLDSGLEVATAQETTAVPGNDASLLQFNLAAQPSGSYEAILSAAGDIPLEQLGNIRFEIVEADPPQLTVQRPTAGEIVGTRNDTALIIATDASGVALVEVSIDGGDFFAVNAVLVRPTEYLVDLAGLSDGTHELSVRATDSLDNSTNVTIVSFDTDTTTPEISITGVSDGESRNSDITPVITFTEANPDVETVTLNGDSFVVGTVITEEGDYVLDVTAIDAAGNAAVEQVTFSIDLTAPVINVTGVIDGEVTDYPITPLIDVTDDNLADVTVTLNGTTFVSGTEISEEGEYTLVVDADDLAGNATNLTINFTIDAGAPEITIEGFTDGDIVNTDITPTITIVDANLDTSTITLNGAAFVSGTTVTAEGDYSLQVDASDTAGNSAAESRSFTIDKTAPVILVTGVSDGEVSAGPLTPVINFTEANPDTTAIALNGAPFVSGTEISAEGVYNLQVDVTDLAGNTADTSLTFTIDAGEPEITISGVTDGEYSTVDITPVVSIVDANLATSSITLNGAPFVSGTTVTDEGAYTLEVGATDSAGNSATASISFVIDRTAPGIAITAVTDGQVTNASITPVIAVTDANLLSEAVTLNGAPFLSGTEITAEGVYTLNVDATDLAGNTTNQTLTFTIDAGDPVITVTGVVDGEFSAVDVTPLVSIVDANLATSSITLNGAPFISGTTVIDEGAYVLNVSADDTAGNSATVSVSFVIDKTAPGILITGVTEGQVSNSAITPVIAVTDANLASESINLNGAPFVSGTPVSADGDYLLAVSATDAAGNVTSQSLSFTIDALAPQIEITGVSAGDVTNTDVVPVISITDINLTSSDITLNGAPYVPGTAITAEGDYSLAVEATDAAGNVATASITFTIDKTAPVILLAGVADGGVSGAAVTLTINVTEANPAGETITLNGNPFVSGSTVSVDGVYTLAASATDQAGNNANQSITFTIDTSDPVIDVTGVTDGEFTNVDVIPVIVITDTNLVSSSILLNGAPFVSGSTVSGEGVYQLEVNATDAAGNAVSTSLSFTIDKTPPSVVVTGVADGDVLNSAVTPVVAITDDNLVSESITLNGAPFVSGTVIAAEGDYVLITTAADEAGNTTAITVNFTIDTTPPEILVSGVSAGDFSALDITPVISVNDINLATTVITLNGSAFTSGTLVGDEGAYLLNIVASDEAGNSASETINFVIDKTAPTIAINGVSDGLVSDTPLTPVVSISDVNPDIQTLTLNGAAFISGTTITSEGDYVLSASATDLAGNTSSQTISFTIDGSAPEVEINGVVDGAAVAEDVTPEITVTDANLSSVTTTLNDAPFTSGTTISAEGVYLLVVTAIDTAGNSVTASRSFIIDKTAPVIEVIGVVDGQVSDGPVTPEVTVTDTNLLEATVTLNGAPYVPGAEIAGEGDYVLVVAASDLAGNTAATTISFTVDASAPVIAISGVADGDVVGADVTPVISVTDVNLDVTTITLNGDPYLSATPVTAEGDYLLSVAATDTAGNASAVSLSFTIDKSAPVILVTGVTEGQYSNTPLFPVISITDSNIDTTSVTLNGAPFISGSEVAQEGDYTLLAQATDQAGNATTVSRNFTVDASAPTILILGVSEGDAVNVDVTPVITIEDINLDASTVLLNGAAFVSGTTINAEGAYQLRASGTDLAGNTATQVVNFIIDKTPPQIAIAGVSNGQFAAVPVTPVINVTDVNLTSTTTTLNGGAFVSGTTVTAEGDYALAVTAEDAAGNTAAASLAFTIDQTPPAIVIAGVTDGQFANVDLAPVVSITDINLASSSLTLNGAPFASGTTVSAEGNYTLVASGTDLAGNAASQTLSFTIDKTPPAIAIGGVINGDYRNNVVTPTIAVTGQAR